MKGQESEKVSSFIQDFIADKNTLTQKKVNSKIEEIGIRKGTGEVLLKTDGVLQLYEPVRKSPKRNRSPKGPNGKEKPYTTFGFGKDK